MVTGPGNLTRLTDPKLDAMGASQSREMDPVKRAQLVQQQLDYEYDIMPFIPVVVRIYQTWQGCRMKNMRPHHGLNAVWGVQHAWIDERGC
jgi:ABC-type transport system substrate-binding protein